MNKILENDMTSIEQNIKDSIHGLAVAKYVIVPPKTNYNNVHCYLQKYNTVLLQK